MNSGIRFSVALIVVIMVLLGFYYASLDDGGGETVGDTPAITVDGESGAAGDAGNGGVATRPAEPMPTPVVAEPEPVTRDVVEVVDEPAVSEPTVAEDGAEFDEYPIADASSDEPVEGDVEGIDETMIESAPDAVEDEPVSAVGEDSPISPVIDDVVEPDDAVDSEAAVTETPTRATPSDSSEKTVRRVGSSGVGIHRVATIERDQSLANAAMRALAEASEVGIVDGPRGSVWIPLPDGVDPALLEGAIVDRVAGDETSLVLVLTGEGDAVDFADRVQSTEVSGSDAAGGWSVRFRLTPGAADTVRTATRSLVGGTVAWIADGRIVAIDRQLIPVSGRGNVPVRFATEADAEAVAERLRTSSGNTTPSRTPSNTGSSAAGNVVVGAGSLPPDQYTDYVVKPGDTFESIAADWFGDRNKHSLIAIANPYKESSRLTIGEVLRLPPKTTEQRIDIPTASGDGGPTLYTVRSGDTLGKIAQVAYGKASLWTKIYEANKATIGADPANLKVGMQLEIPR